MKMSFKGTFEMGLTEVPEKLAKELQDELEQLDSKLVHCKVKIEEDD